ncbi:MAG: nucleotide exchange factor GrpE [Erysipelotrichaceae bacterium]|nr:nucleotide exchange factor GrpE [Erysipelotrichaceae bacterium]MBQ1304376.1 nucleotide exchange factor GrpE [Erysipelotrichaceae bacterium]MBR2791650.1 nucleotide exchange factor GrpE [Erysipelotrichaceae bacterium]
MSRKHKEEKVEIKDNAEELPAEEEAKEEVPETDALLQDIENLKAELAKTKNDYFKAYADTDNLRKRLLNEAEQNKKYHIQSFALSILPSIDSLERALDGKDLNDPFVKGVKLTYDQIIHALSLEGVTEIDCLNKPFDANYCQALMTEQVEGVEANTVVEVLQKGYMLKDRLLRAALVKVSE